MLNILRCVKILQKLCHLLMIMASMEFHHVWSVVDFRLVHLPIFISNFTRLALPISNFAHMAVRQKKKCAAEILAANYKLSSLG